MVCDTQRVPARTYFPALDGLRAISVIGVITWHARGDTLNFLHGGNGVWVFFVLSGFLITTLSLREEDKRGRLDWKAFFIRRVFRILPLYYLVLAGYAVLVLVLNIDHRHQAFTDALPYYGLYFQEHPFFAGFHGGDTPFAISWTLGIEEKFYLLWPLIAFVILKRSRFRAPLSLAVAGLFIGLDVMWPTGAARYFQPYSHILLGCCLAFLLHDRKWFDRLRPLGHPGVLISAVLAATVVTFIPFKESHAFFFSVPVVIALASILLTTSRLPRVLEWAPLRRLGVLSYAFYLTHQMGLQIMNRIIPESAGTVGNLATIVFAFPLVVVGCEILHRLVEQPMIDVGRRLSRRVSAKDDAAPSHGSRRRMSETPRRAQLGANTRGCGTGRMNRPPRRAYSACCCTISSVKFHARSSR